MHQPSALFRFTLPATAGQAEEWHRVSSKDGNISALFPVDIRKDLQTQTDRTVAGKVKSQFGEHRGDGILTAGSGSDIPLLARGAGDNAIFNGSKKTVLTQARGTEIRFEKTSADGAPTRILVYKGDAYRGKWVPYQGRALFVIVNKRIYIINSVISKPTGENRAAEKKLLSSIKVKKYPPP